MPSEARFRHLMDTAPVMIWCSGAHGGSIYFNKVWLDFTGRTMQQEIGEGWELGVHPEDYVRREKLYAEHFAKREQFRVEYRLLRRDGAWRWLLGTGVPRYDAEEQFEGFIGSCIDITEMKEAAQQRQADLDEKAALLQELHHRVKNNAQVFASLLMIQANRAKDPEVSGALRTAAARASAMAITQQQIHDSGSSAEFDVGYFAHRLGRARLTAAEARGERIALDVKTTRPVLVPLATAVPLGLILNELLTNALRHAFPNDRMGRVEVRLEQGDDGSLCMEVRDDGVGLRGVDIREQRSAGLTIVRSLTRQLGGTLSFESERGTRVCLQVPPRA